MLLTVRFPAIKSPLSMTENLSGGQLSHVLWRWLVGLLFKKIQINSNQIGLLVVDTGFLY